jgi:lysozyme
MNATKLIESLKKHEGFRARAYKDTEGHWTVGYGRNLEAMVVSEKQAGIWLSEDAAAAINEAERFPEYASLDTTARQNAFVEMVFNLGRPKLMQFRKMLAAIRERDFGRAAVEMLDSKWARQVGRRAEVLATMMRTGEFLD